MNSPNLATQEMARYVALMFSNPKCYTPPTGEVTGPQLLTYLLLHSTRNMQTTHGYDEAVAGWRSEFPEVVLPYATTPYRQRFDHTRGVELPYVAYDPRTGHELVRAENATARSRAMRALGYNPTNGQNAY